MPYSYKERVKQCIKAALRECPCTLEEIINKCHGAYPTIVNELLTESSIYSKLVPLYTTSQESIPYFVQDSEMDYKKTDLITYSLENNPALSNWYKPCAILSNKIPIWTILLLFCITTFCQSIIQSYIVQVKKRLAYCWIQKPLCRD